MPISTPPLNPTRSPAIGGESAFTYCGSSFSQCDGYDVGISHGHVQPACRGPASARRPARPAYTASWLMRPDVSHIGLAVDTGDGGSCRWKRPPLGSRTRLVIIIIFGLWVKTIPAVCRYAAILPVKNKQWQTPHFRTYSRRALYDLPQTLHVDRARRAHYKRCHQFFDPTYSFSYRVHGKIWPNLPTRDFSAITP